VSFERAEDRRGGSIRFDLFELDGKRTGLRRSGVAVDLPPQAFRVLVMLAERPNELVMRQEIKEALWPGQSFGDFDSRLNFAIKKLREALGDDAEQPRYIQTVRNAGYRFIAPVREQQAPSPVLLNSIGQPAWNNGSDLSESTRRTMVAGNGFRLGRRALFLALVTAVATAAVLALRQGKTSEPALSEAKGPPLATTSVEYQPRIDSVSAIQPEARQRIVITGRGFGLHVPYVHTDSPYLAVRDLTAHWSAGRMIPQNTDEVMVDVHSWTDTEIVVSGFSGDYGLKGSKLAPGDELEIAVWNPQSGVGPGLFHVTVTLTNVAR
jgi:DNA-binding winged helix-turn-helix (wHTH) protein